MIRAAIGLESWVLLKLCKPFWRGPGFGQVRVGKVFLLARLPPSAGCWNEVLLVGLIPPSHCVSRSWSRGKRVPEFGSWMNVLVCFGSFWVVVLPRQQEMESWCFCVSDGLRYLCSCGHHCVLLPACAAWGTGLISRGFPGDHKHRSLLLCPWQPVVLRCLPIFSACSSCSSFPGVRPEVVWDQYHQREGGGASELAGS